MAKRTNNNSNNKPIIINQLNVRAVNRKNIDIQKWRNALQYAEGESRNRYALYDIYEEIILDGHLTSIMEKRINAIMNLELKFFDKNLEENDEINDLIKKTFFEKLLREIINAKFWGFSLIELDWLNSEQYQNKTYCIDRRHVKPELNIVTINPTDYTGINYTEFKNVVLVDYEKKYGLLLQASPYVIFKRNNYSDWAEYNEIFGRPYPHGSYENDDTGKILTEAFDKAGFESYMVAPKDAEIKLHESTNGSGSAQYSDLKDAMNEELSILFLGQNLTTKAGSTGSYAASKTHGEVEEGINIADREFVIKVLNEKILPVLNVLGYKAEGEFRYVYSDEIPIKDRIDIDIKLANLIPIDEDYFYETYNVPKGTKKKVEAPAKQEPQKQQLKKTVNKQSQKSWVERLQSFFVKRAVLKF